MTARWTRLVPLATVVAAALVVAACGEDRDSSRPMTQGEQLAIDNGCATCHGGNGEGGTGPALKGSFGTQVQLSDGSTATVDDAYLVESIADPAAKSRPGYGAMPTNSLSDAEILAIVEFIKSLK